MRRERSDLRRRQGAEEDEDSDWDQCSTANFNVDEEAQTKGALRVRAGRPSCRQKRRAATLTRRCAARLARLSCTLQQTLSCRWWAPA